RRRLFARRRAEGRPPGKSRLPQDGAQLQSDGRHRGEGLHRRSRRAGRTWAARSRLHLYARHLRASRGGGEAREANRAENGEEDMNGLELPRRSVVIWAAVVSSTCILAVGLVVGYVTFPLVKRVWQDANTALSWFALVINLAAQLLAVWIIYALFRRSSGRRAEILRLAVVFALGYVAVALLATAYGAAATPLAIFASNSANIDSSWTLMLSTIVVPVAIAAGVLVFVPRGEHAAQS